VERIAVTRVLATLFIAALAAASAPPAGAADPPVDARTKVILVVGAAGEAEYGSNFINQATHWKEACAQAEAQVTTFGLEQTGPTNDLELVKQELDREPKDCIAPLWLVLIGHGTFDGKEAWFNLRGPDMSAATLGSWLKPFHRPVVVIDNAAASGPFINKLSATNRVIITATRSGSEQNFARFGQYFADALTNPEADLDQDGQVSALEAFLYSSRKATEFYKSQGRLATEHALLDDNGDGLGTPADWFRGLRATRQAKDGAALDGLLAQQLRLVPSPAERSLSPEQVAERDALEKAVLLHRERKADMSEADYYRELEALLLKLARFYAANSATNAAK